MIMSIAFVAQPVLVVEAANPLTLRTMPTAELNDGQKALLKIVGVVGGVGAGIGLASYGISKAGQSSGPWTWQGAGLSTLAGGAGVLIGGLAGGFLGSTIGKAMNGREGDFQGGLLGLAIGAIGGAIIAGLLSGRAGDKLAARGQSSSSPSTGSVTTNRRANTADRALGGLRGALRSSP
jgi:hypothetical protein